ncbi:MAG: orotate phosphoribosyltransferase [Acidobacteria bacterium]|nr:MAG: orotate phosphoribosyltransferase [Acidobacteriota bacterium]
MGGNKPTLSVPPASQIPVRGPESPRRAGCDKLEAFLHRTIMENRAKLREILCQKSVRWGRVKLSSGQESDFYFDCKRTTLDPEGSVLTAKTILDLLDEKKISADAIGGLTLGADPIVASVAAVSFYAGKPLQAFIIRKERKTHGMQKQIEGPMLERGSKVVIVDEVCTTGKSTMEAVEIAEREGLEVTAVVSLVDREEGGSEQLRGKYRYLSVFTGKELLENARIHRKRPEEATQDSEPTTRGHIRTT